jgi:D-amino-acid dehydrogenase
VRTLVIGGGVIGLTLAYHLARAGEEVCVLDARATGQGASDVNAGWICPAEAMPVPGPGAVALTLRSMLRPDSPVYVHPSLDPAFVRFMLGLWRRSNARDQRAGFEAHLRLAADSVHWFDAYRADGMDFEMHTRGLLMAFTQQKNLDHHRANLDLVDGFGLEPRVLSGDDVRVHEPALSDAVRGGIYFPKERHVVPGTLARALHRRLLELGVRIVEDAPVDAVDVAGGRVRSVRTPGATHEADRFVLAAGAWSGPLSRRFGTPLPIRPGKGYSVDLPPVALRSPTNLSDVKVAVSPFATALRLAGTMEFAGWDEKVNAVRVAAILRAPRTYFRDWVEPETPPVARAGMRPMTPDGMPVIGRLPGLDNAFVSSGHGMLGVTFAAGSADALTDLILGPDSPPVLEPFDPARFSSRSITGRARPWQHRPTSAGSSSRSPRRSRRTGPGSTSRTSASRPTGSSRPGSTAW